MNALTRTFEARPAVRGAEPLLIGIAGPPGGGKSMSSLRIAEGIKTMRGGDIVLIDTEGGRARKYADSFQFLHVDFQPPHRPGEFLEAIKQQLSRNPSCIIVDSLSDEHEGQGGYLEWHDELVPRMGGNEWAAWAKPKADRKRLITGLYQIRTPLIFTFRAREKTQASREGSKTKVVNLGWMPVAPLEIVHALDLVCVLPPRADGVPVWSSEKIGEDFIIKLPGFLAHCIQQGKPLDEATGRALAQWAAGTSSAPHAETPAPSTDAPPPGTESGAGDDAMRAAFIASVRRHIDAAPDYQTLGLWWQSDEQKRARRDFELTVEQVAGLVAHVTARLAALKPADAAKEQQQ